jgi:hypothetical protein
MGVQLAVTGSVVDGLVVVVEVVVVVADWLDCPFSVMTQDNYLSVSSQLLMNRLPPVTNIIMIVYIGRYNIQGAYKLFEDFAKPYFHKY